MKSKPLFGPAGNSLSFYDMGYKSSVDTPKYLKAKGLTAFEYQCGRGVNIGLPKCVELRPLFAAEDIQISIHAPYYISLASPDETKRLNSINYIMQSARALHAMGGERIVIHPGACTKFSREEAADLAVDTFKLAMKALGDEGLSHMRLCPETMGKINQLGDLDEVLTFCELDERFIPCIDFGHLNARTLGGLSSLPDYEEVFIKIKNRLGESRLREFHSHFSKIEYTNGGEKRHLTFSDTQFGPDFQPVMELCYKYSCSCTFICESDGTQAEDAVTMKQYFESLKGDV